jgi:diadenosine tetraphosphate (Ap4A) HIT family hydrolase
MTTKPNHQSDNTDTNFRSEHMNPLEDFRIKFEIQKYTVAENDSWVWSLRPNQVTLGSSILSLKRHATKFSEVTAAEMKDLQDLIVRLESSVKKTFNYEIMNYLMLMMVDHHVHFHVIPRYPDAKKFKELEWIDKGWPSLPVMAESQHKDRVDVIEKVKEELVLAVTK